MKTKLCGILFALAITVFSYGILFAAEEEIEYVFEGTVGQFVEKFNSNELAAEDAYLSERGALKYIKLTGIVDSVTKDIMNGDEVIVMKLKRMPDESNTGVVDDVKIAFHNSWRPHLVSLKPGDEVTQDEVVCVEKEASSLILFKAGGWGNDD